MLDQGDLGRSFHLGFISEHTVNNHLRSIFEKASVNSRREMVRRLFFENLLPGVLGG